MTKVFISYAWKDGTELAAYFYHELTARGAEVFRDTENFDLGDPLPTRLQREIESADCVLVLLTCESKASAWVKAEATWACDCGRNIIPVVVDQTAFEVFFFLKNRWGIALNTATTDEKASAIRQLAGSLKLPEEIPFQVSHRIPAHTDGVNDIAFSPDGKFLASVSDDETVVLWSMPNKSLGRRIPKSGDGFENWALSVTFSPDSRFLAFSWYDATIDLLDLQTGDWTEVKSDRGLATYLKFLAGGARLVSFHEPSCGENSGISLWELPDLCEYGPFILLPSCPAFRDSGEMLAWADDETTLNLWHFTDNETEPIELIERIDLQTPSEQSLEISSIAFSPTNPLILYLSNPKRDVIEMARGLEERKDGALWIYNLDGALVKQIPLGRHRVGRLTFSAQGHLLALVADEKIEILKTTDWSHYSTVPLEAAPTCLSFTPDDRILAAGMSDGTIGIVSVFY